MQYFAMNKQARASQFMKGQPNSIYTEVFPDEDFGASGYWFWLKSAGAHGFDVKAFDRTYIYIRSTELTWNDNTTFKRFNHDLPIAPRCVAPGAAGAEIQIADTNFQYFASCAPYKSSNLANATTTLDAPVPMDVGGNVGEQSTRVLHYRYHCDSTFRTAWTRNNFSWRRASAFGSGSIFNQAGWLSQR